jgi:hypothetical protein
MVVNIERLEQWTHTAGKQKIKALIQSNQTFTETKNFFKPSHPEDEKIIQTYYTELLLNSLPQKVEYHFNSLISDYEEDLFAEWIDIVYTPKPNSEFKELLQNMDFYKCLKDLKTYKEDMDLTFFYKMLRKEFRVFFTGIETLHGIIGIYQCLLRCESCSQYSPIFCNAVTSLWQKCEFENNILHLDNVVDAEVHPQHHQLAELVENFTSTNLENIKELIKVRVFNLQL